MKNVLLCFFNLILIGTGIGQTTLLFEDFEDATVGYSTSVPEFTDGVTDYFIRTDGSNIASSVVFSDVLGSSFFGAQDTNGEGGPSNVQLDFEDIDISGFLNLNLSLFLAEDDDGSNEDWDGNSEFTIQFSIDNGPFQDLFVIDAPETNTEPRFNGTTTFLTDAFTEYDFDISGSGSSIDIRILIDNLNDGDEDIAFDNIEITGVPDNTTIVNFSAPSSAEDETNAPFDIDIPVLLSNYLSSTVDLSVSVTGGTAEMTDYVLNTSSLSFTGDGSQNVSLTINEDAGFDDETIELTLTETSSTGAFIGINTHTVTIVDDEDPPAPPLVINELLADPNDVIDANGDGTIDNSNDEFVEIVNTTNSPIDISGYRISDGFGVRFTFPNETILPGGWAATVFGGGTPTDIPGLTFTAALGLNNGGDVVTLDDGTSSRADIDSHTYGNNESDGVALARSPDFTGPFVAHNIIATNPVLASPGRENTTGAILPVDLISFEAQIVYSSIHLNWTTASEINNDFFEVQRSTDRVNFETIGRVKGNGTTNNELAYNFVDRDPKSGINYYRLAQFDFNGDMEYHKVISVEIRGSKSNIYPTIVTDFVNVVVDEPSTLSIFTMDGKFARNIRLEESDHIDLSQLAPGVYNLRIQTNGQVEVHRFIKQ